MAGRYNPDEYEPVEERLRAFWDEHPHGSVTTELVHHSEKQFVVKAYVYASGQNTVGGRLLATGYAEETVGSSQVNRTSALENCETSAIGRALANAGYAPKGKRPSREEMEKANRATPARVTRAAEARDELRGFCATNGYDLKTVADMYAEQHGEALADTENYQKIQAFAAALRRERFDLGNE